jgi:hypothetical protein
MAPSNSIISADILVQRAKSCEELAVEKHKGSGMFVRAKRCCFCQHVVKLGAGSADYSLVQHMRSFDCQKAQKSLASVVSPPSLSESDSKPPSICAPTSLRLQSATSVDVCPGALVDYGISMFSNYPWHLHDTGTLSYTFSFIDPQGRFCYVQSRVCYQKSPGNGLSCEACSQVVMGRQFQELLKRAATASSSLPPTLKLQYRTYPQVCDLLDKKNSQINSSKLNVRLSFEHYV